MLIKITRPGGIRFSHHGWDVVEYAPGECDVPEEVATLALAEKWAEPVKNAPAAESASPKKSAKSRKGSAATAGE